MTIPLEKRKAVNKMKKKLSIITMMFVIMCSIFMISRTESQAAKPLRYQVDICQISSMEIKNSKLRVRFDDGTIQILMNKKVSKTPYDVEKKSLTAKPTNKTIWDYTRETYGKSSFYGKTSFKEIMKVYKSERKKYLDFLKKHKLEPSAKGYDEYDSCRLEKDKYTYHCLYFFTKKGKLVRCSLESFIDFPLE